MSYYISHDEYEEDDDDELQVMESVTIYPPAPCCICGMTNQTFGCYRCGKPVCMDAENYMHDAPSGCGAWIMDWHSNGAMSPDDGNEYYCQTCLGEVYGVSDAAMPQVQTK